MGSYTNAGSTMLGSGSIDRVYNPRMPQMMYHPQMPPLPAATFQYSHPGGQFRYGNPVCDPRILIDKFYSTQTTSLGQYPPFPSVNIGPRALPAEGLSVIAPSLSPLDQLHFPPHVNTSSSPLRLAPYNALPSPHALSSPHARVLSEVPSRPNTSHHRYNVADLTKGSPGSLPSVYPHHKTLNTTQGTVNWAEHSAPSDSGYGSISHPRLEGSIAQALMHSSHPGTSNKTKYKKSDDVSTIYSDTESIQIRESGLVRYITEFAEELSGMFPTSLSYADLARFKSTLPIIFKAFAFKLGFCDASPSSRTLVYLVHRYRQ